MNTWSGLASWSAAIAHKPRMDEEAYLRFTCHPRFAEACNRSALSWLKRQQGNVIDAQLTTDIASIFYCVFALYLHASGELTLAGIKNLCAESGQASHGRAAALMLKLLMAGYIVPDPATAGQRKRRFIPAPAWQDAMREIFRDQMIDFSLIEPEAAVAAAWLDDPEVFRQLILIAGNGFKDVARQKLTTPITPFANHNAGIAILFFIAMSGEDGDVYPPRGPVRIAVKDLSRRFGVSRPHVRRLLHKVERLGLLERDSENLTGVLSDPLREELKLFHVVMMAGVGACLYCAKQAASGNQEFIPADGEDLQRV